ncbi:hypothetical protein GCM10008910_23510 [Faecalicatena orotica]|uniref:Beta-lactamase regulating signal transducer with metallopeptidase domain n=1 Tax=Faecalicatena orotica TaxID=1544 RepID=A0A2Y9BKC9_9FIRM|nr:M56 family metallopeptidase [Faecalicatena orotica]PWJ20705.1 beta-lactamase regulating signal transducer with metallopeptidase domain [Faecalicatena orotica]SSA58504.1 Signal transducer regulating beta-lactamase production, contains metallopeptidase domain [Faecalicatena orotica]
MEAVFLQLLNMSIAGSWMIFAVMLLRFPLKKAPRWVTCVLWGLVGIRLIFPFSIESILSLIPSAQTIPENFVHMEQPAISSGIDVVNQIMNPVLSRQFAPDPASSADPLQIITYIVSVIWLIGMALMLLYMVCSFFILKAIMRTAVRVRGNVWQSERVRSPFVLGMIRPRIYLPFHMSSAKMKYVIAHEKAHIRRHDHWTKPIGFLVLTVYWFNPAIWAAYILLCRDIEVACDESAVRNMGVDERKSYSMTLLSFGSGHHTPAICPLAFGEGNIRQRVKNVLNYKKPVLWMLIAAVIVCTAVAVCFMTNPKEKIQKVDALEVAVKEAILEYWKDDREEVDFQCESHVTLAELSGERTDEKTGKTIETKEVYAMVCEQSVSYDEEPFTLVGASSMPAVLSFDVASDGSYNLTDYWVPQDGDYNEPSIRERFAALPPEVAEEALDTQKYAVSQIQDCYTQIVEYGDVDTARILEKLFDVIMASPDEMLSPQDIIQAHPVEYRELIFYNDYTVQYIRSKIKEDKVSGTEAEVMRRIMAELTGE